jgi:hypothetical protein
MEQGDSKAAEREARLAAQLRDNLRRRKQQARAAIFAPAPVDQELHTSSAPASTTSAPETAEPKPIDDFPKTHRRASGSGFPPDATSDGA